MFLKTAGVVGHIILDILLIPFMAGTALLVMFAGTLGMSAGTLVMGFIFLVGVVLLLVDIIVTLALGIASAGSRRAIIYQWYLASIVGLLAFGLGVDAGLNPALALLCAVAVDAGLFLRQRLFRAAPY